MPERSRHIVNERKTVPEQQIAASQLALQQQEPTAEGTFTQDSLHACRPLHPEHIREGQSRQGRR